MTERKILVTGGAGYIGAHTVVELISAGHVPVIVDNLSKSDRRLLAGIEKMTGKKVLFCHGDCADKDFLHTTFREHGPISSVMHFAAYKSVGESVEHPLDYYRNNVTSLLSLLEVMKNFKVTDLVFSSSCTVYGQPDQVPVTESAPLKRAESPYGATKQMCERILEDANVTGYRLVSLRYFNPIGAHPSGMIGELSTDVPSNLVPYITQTAAGRRETLTVFGSDYGTPDGTCIRDYIHVVDVAKAHLKAIEYIGKQGAQNLFRVFNLGTGKGVSVLELIRKFEEITGVKLPFVMGPRRPGDVEKTYADPGLANREIGWRCEYSVEDALEHAWNWEKRLQQQAV